MTTTDEPRAPGPRDERLLSAEELAEIRHESWEYVNRVLRGTVSPYGPELWFSSLFRHIDAMAAENARLAVALEDMVDLDPYGVDSADYWCIYCCEHGDKPEAIKHDPLCTWVRAEAVLTRRADGGA